VQAAERQLAELADPPGLYYLTLEEWVHEWLFPVYRRSVLRARPRLVAGPLPAPEFVARKRRWTSGSSAAFSLEMTETPKRLATWTQRFVGA
jgi:hypothetical protein